MDNNKKSAIIQKPPTSRDMGIKQTGYWMSFFKRSLWWLAGLLIFIVFSKTTHAQPLPPATPDGSPVPVDSFLSLLVIAGVIIFVKSKSKNKTD
ncbi:MAG: hypothetical protein JW798_14780 [Prolixibacteraceae bacterium]|nr:hypothetical protein [Prolixibacteraceae bacterium]